jgi:hypothetical protein
MREIRFHSVILLELNVVYPIIMSVTEISYSVDNNWDINKDTYAAVP